MTDLTDERLAEIRALAEAATPGDWMACNMVHAERGDQMTPEEIGEYVTNSVKLGDPDRFLFITTSGEIAPDICHIGNGPAGPANAAFIAAAKPANVLSLLDALTSTRERAERAETEREDALEILCERYVTRELTKLARHAIDDIKKANDTICRLRGETDADADLRRFVHYVDHQWPMSPGEVSSIIDFAQGQMSRATAAEARVAALEAVLRQIAEGLTPPVPEGHYLAHRAAVKAARAALTTEKTDG